MENTNSKTAKQKNQTAMDWARELQAIAQTGLHFAVDDYNRQRYGRLMEIAAQIAARQSGLDEEELLAVFLRQRGYATPKIDVRGAVFREGKLLLVRERADGGWCMPGGWADVGDAPAEMVEREVREESGLIVRAEKVLGVFDANRDGQPQEVFHAYKIVFQCRDFGGNPSSSNETSEAGFFGEDAIPVLSRERTDVRHIREVFAHFRDPARAAAFE